GTAFWFSPGVMNPNGYRVYLLRSASGLRYIGLSNDVERRVQQHNLGISRWTRGKGPWILEWTSTPRSLGDARKLENLLKRQKGGAGLDPILLREASPGS
ncbi:MAG: GIY-YIG nuclease family protein, partial [Verrucomicrobiota bacterium]